MKHIFEQEDNLEPFKHKDVNLEEEMVNFVSLKNSLKDDKDQYKKFLEAAGEFGVKESNIAVISSYSTTEKWEDITNELDRRQIEYYEFNDINGESNILFDANDL